MSPGPHLSPAAPITRNRCSLRLLRRFVLVLAAVSALVAGLAACGSDSTTASSPGSSGGGLSESGGATAGFPVTVATKFGAVTIPRRPTRVVALGWGDAETALSLGVQPVGASDWLGFGGEGVGPWAQGRYQQAPTLIATLQPDYEKVAALHPDLILDTKSSGDPARYQRLSSIAPTVDVPSGADNYLTTTAQQVTMVSAALGVPDKGKQILAGLDSDFQQAASAHPEFKGKTVVVAAYTSNGWGAYVARDERVQFLEKLGFVLSPRIAALKTDQFSVPVSTEKLDQLNADVLVTFPIYVAASKVTTQGAYQSLAVVQQKHAIVVSDTNVGAAFSLGTPLAITYAIDHLLPSLSAASQST